LIFADNIIQAIRRYFKHLIVPIMDRRHILFDAV